MKWKLRIPMMLFIFGLVSGIYQYNPNIIIFKESYILNSLQYLASIGIPIYLCEKTGLNEKRVHFSIGIILIILGLLIDYSTM
ncbi:hypothetical protein JOC85_001861 [Bacillus mesophilus]|uniref:Uncharacterized protein n=1 Tax=Bacillus mesophilus TaxID=1808955 RepID=A0A6M0Q8P1_9BACI|nr:hypothetical protein [Bacillus mesophilus]MBM7661089.1 hypothetical protein [Bacillus mesophilus]NEY71378.1 hypothetical protein [Bacillus mesophilus]